jgi:hypothetical protein
LTDRLLVLEDSFPQMVGVKELAKFFSVSSSTVTNWAFRQFDNGFPEPMKRLAAGPIYRLSDVVLWYIRWHPRVGPKVGTLPDLDEYFNSKEKS